MRRHFLKFIFLIIATYSFPSIADFTLYWRDQNYFLFESRGFSTLDLNGAGALPNDTFYSTVKIHMKPSFSITDRLSIHSAFDAFSSPTPTTSQEEGGLMGTQATDANQYGPNLPNLPRQLFGGTSGYGHSSLTAGDSNFLIRNAFVEYIGDWGIFRVGRQPRQWGLGIRYNAGDKATDKFSDRTDTLSYELGLGNFKVAALYSKILENNVKSDQDDVTSYESYLNWNDPENDIDTGALFTYLHSVAQFIKLQTFDGYFKKKWSNLKFGAETVISTGQPGTIAGNNAFQVGLATEFSYQVRPAIEVFAKTGYASGASLAHQGKLTLFAFNRNYDIAVLMFNQGLGELGASKGTGTTNIMGVDASSDPDVNAILSAYYLNVGGNYSFNDRIGVGMGIAYAQSPENITAGGDKTWGQELDFKAWYQFSENIKLKADLGAFFPGDIYSGTPLVSPAAGTDTAVGGQLNAIVTF